MKDISDKLLELFKFIKEPKYFYIGIGILIIVFLFLPFLKFLAVIIATVFIFISFFPNHTISEKVHGLIEHLKSR